jgi:hypothetical protein
MTSIAFSIGKRDHSTIVYAVKKVRDDMEVYEPILELVYDVFVFVYGSDAYFPKDLKKLIKDEVRKD